MDAQAEPRSESLLSPITATADRSESTTILVAKVTAGVNVAVARLRAREGSGIRRNGPRAPGLAAGPESVGPEGRAGGRRLSFSTMTVSKDRDRSRLGGGTWPGIASLRPSRSGPAGGPPLLEPLEPARARAGQTVAARPNWPRISVPTARSTRDGASGGHASALRELLRRGAMAR